METAQSTKGLYRQDQALRLHGNFLPLALRLSEEKLLILNIPEKKKKTQKAVNWRSRHWRWKSLSAEVNSFTCLDLFWCCICFHCHPHKIVQFGELNHPSIRNSNRRFDYIFCLRQAKFLEHESYESPSHHKLSWKAMSRYRNKCEENK